jgi:hypothetical protein
LTGPGNLHILGKVSSLELHFTRIPMRLLVAVITVCVLLLPEPPKAEACFLRRFRTCAPVSRGEGEVPKSYKIYVAKDVARTEKKDPIWEWELWGGPYTIGDAHDALSKHHSATTCVACGTRPARNYVCVCPDGIDPNNPPPGYRCDCCPPNTECVGSCITTCAPCPPAPYGPRRFFRR